MKKILIATKNSHKQKKLSGIVSEFYTPDIKKNLQDIKEVGNSFLEIAENKAKKYSKIYKCLAISTDSGAVIPALGDKWDPIKTKRFASTDKERIKKLLKMMKGKKNRVIEWYEALAVANNGKLIFSTQAKAMDGEIDKIFNPKFYREGIWLCSITSFSQFNGKNFFELTDAEIKKTENSWGKLKQKFQKFIKKALNKALYL